MNKNIFEKKIDHNFWQNWSQFLAPERLELTVLNKKKAFLISIKIPLFINNLKKTQHPNLKLHIYFILFYFFSCSFISQANLKIPI